MAAGYPVPDGRILGSRRRLARRPGGYPTLVMTCVIPVSHGPPPWLVGRLGDLDST